MFPLVDASSRREFLARLAKIGVVCSVSSSRVTFGGANADHALPDPALTFPGPWTFTLPKGGIILVSDPQLEDLTDADKEVDLSLSATPNRTTLRKLCEQQRAAGAKTIILAFDEFWSQYRAGQGGQPRALTPDLDEYLRRVVKISETLKSYGLGLELSLLSPLEIGRGYAKKTGESGRWVHYREGWRDPRTGRFRVSLWEQLRWTNNKGTIELTRSGMRVFAFRERRVGRTSFYAVNSAEIVELQQPVEIEAAEPDTPRAKERRLTISGSGDTQVGPLNRVLVVVSYAVPEMDYFSPQALPFLEDLVRRYHQAGVPLHGLYADEMHIQQDWGYASHHEEGQFALRYLTKHLERRFAELHGAEFADLEKHLVYFCYGQHGFYPNLEARLAAQHVFGDSPEDIQRTFLLRRRYFDLLEKTVVDLFARAKESAEKLYGHELEARAHATWAQSPTIDFWRTGNAPHAPRQYDYTPDFLWSNTVQQAASACSDYFRWNAFLTGGGNDHAEGGWSDRNYYALALACSTGILNRTPNAYAAAWGMPASVHRRHRALENAFGCAPDPAFMAIQDGQHRDVEVLMLYPLSLVACEERFGSWMTQYGYANYVTPEKLLERGRVATDGWIEMAGRRFGTIAVLFEPLPPPGLLAFLEEFVAKGGKLIWSGPPSRFDLSGAPALERWQRLLGVKSLLTAHEGLIAAGSQVEFDGTFKPVTPQMILTDFLVDHIYPVEPDAGTQVVARVAGRVVVVHRPAANGGSATFLGFRPRDDQAASLGYEVRTWFDILKALGAYPPSRAGLSANDNPSVVSRESPYLATRFPNGTVTIAAHYRSHVESWPGGFHRDAKRDDEIVAKNPLPPDTLELQTFRVAGHTVDYRGTLLVAFRLDAQQRLIAFGGHDCASIRLGDHEHVFADRAVPFIAWAPVSANRRVVGGAVLEIWLNGEAKVRIPFAEKVSAPRLHFAGGRPGAVGESVPVRISDGFLEFDAKADWPPQHLYLLAG
ncbi:MAG: hypothetical protein AAB676_20120 [Verrucomicrobiota bacterium]